MKFRHRVRAGLYAQDRYKRGLRAYRRRLRTPLLIVVVPAKSPVVRLVDVAGAICVYETVDEDFVVVRRLRGRLNRQRRRSALHLRAIDPLLPIQIWDARPAKRKTAIETARVWHVLAELCDEDRQLSHTRRANVLILQSRLILRRYVRQ
jgi:hypothetical protein